MSMAEFNVKEVTVFIVATSLNKALRQIQFLRNFQRNIQHKSGLPNVISIRNNNFRLFKYRHR